MTRRTLRVQRRWTVSAPATTALAACALTLFPLASKADTWAVNRDASTIAFSGTHAGAAFTGTFETWRADIQFDPADLTSAKADVRVDLTSANTGNMTYDKTLPTADWFDTNSSSEGRFVTNAFRAAGENAFEADGTLTIRSFEVPVTLAFTFERNGDSAVLKGKTKLKRMAFGIGKGSDASGAWVSLDIPVTVDVALTKAPEKSVASPKS
ncbi:MAG: YceI family protein [Pseudomonadota bacterium]